MKDSKVLEKIEQRLSAIEKAQQEQNATLIRQEGVLAEHVYRTDLAEQAIKRLQTAETDQNNLIQQMKGAVKVLTALATIIAASASLAAVFHYLH